MGRLREKVSIITGGGSGMGAAACARFAAEGSRVVVADSDGSSAEAVADAINGSGGRAVPVEVDVRDESAVDDMVGAAIGTWGRLDVLYNNAGVSPAGDGTPLETTAEIWDLTFDVNVKGMFLCCRAAIPAMLDGDGGSIINVASFVAHVGAATPQLAYTSSKGAVLSMTKELATIYARDGIRANALCPGPVLTPLLAKFMENEQERQRRLVHIPMGRFGEVDEMVNGALFLASDESSFMTGQSLLIDGGITAPTRPRSDHMLTIDELTTLVGTREIDTVLVVFPDMQGRLVGKRVVADFFLSEIPTSGGAIEACDYLLAVDVDMEVLEGFKFTSWETGYGDFICRPDLSTLRVVPWLDRTAMVICDLLDHEGTSIEVAPRTVLRRQLDRASEAGYVVKAGTELEFYLFKESMEEAWDMGFANLTPANPYIIDYHILATTKDEELIARIRNDMVAAGIPVENSKGEAGKGQHELNLRYAEALVMADNHTIYKNGAKEIAALANRAITFMAKYTFDDAGSSCHVHSSLWDAETDRSAMPATGGDHDAEMSDTFRWYLGGLLATAADFALCWAPFVNSYKRFQPGSWAPTAIGWDTDNRTLGFRVVGHGQGLRVESRIPGADCNPYIALAATVAGGLYGIENRIEPPEPTPGNGYTADLPRIPDTLAEAMGLFERSEIAKAAFGEDVHFHLLHMARQDWRAFNRTVTDWELRRNFDRL